MRGRVRIEAPLAGLLLGAVATLVAPPAIGAAEAPGKDRPLPPPPPPPAPEGDETPLPPPPPVEGTPPGREGERAVPTTADRAAPGSEGPSSLAGEAAPIRKRRGLTTISILPFESGEELEDDVGDKIGEALEWELNRSGRFRILSRHQFTREQNNRLREIQANFAAPKTRVPFQRLTCEQAFVSGSVRKQENLFIFTMYVIDLATEEKILIERRTCYHLNAFRRIARDFARAILDRVDILAHVKAVADGNVVYLDPEDAAEGVRPGDHFSLVKTTDPVVVEGEVIDPGHEEEYGRVAVDAILPRGYVHATVELLKEGHRIEKGDAAHLIPGKRTAAASRRRSLGFLPFETVAGAKDTKAFAEVLREELVSYRAPVMGYRVRDPRGILDFKGNEDHRVICDALGLDAIVGGKIAVQDGSVVIYLRFRSHPQSRDPGEPEEEPEGREINRKVVVEGEPTVQNAERIAKAIVKALEEAATESSGASSGDPSFRVETPPPGPAVAR